MPIDHKSERDRHTQLILQSTASHKLIVAGAGTGKSHTFKELLKAAPEGDRLVVTFINNLARGLKGDLAGLADARTFHSLCKKLLHKRAGKGITTGFRFYPLLERVIAQDASALAIAEALPNLRFGDAFQTLAEDGRIEFFLGRANYYDAVGFDDSVFRTLQAFSDEDAIPSHALLLVDEFQDFNLLEVRFIEALATKAPTVIVGDDDQAVYDFRNSSPLFLRDKATDQQYTRFELPYCSRCTAVVVEATREVIQQAANVGVLGGRLAKPYVCYEPDKLADSTRYPEIIKATISTQTKKVPYVGRYIANVLRALPDEEVAQAADPEKGYPLALVIGPPDRYYLRMLRDYLAEQFEDVVFHEQEKRDPDLADGYAMLAENAGSNLGWRILVGCLIPDMLEGALKATDGTAALLRSVLDDTWCEEQLSIAALVGEAQSDPTALTDQQRQVVLERVGMSAEEIAQRHKTSVEEEEGTARRPKIQLCTYNGAKGLSGGFVFVVGLEDGTLPKKNGTPTDTEACQFLVALTRTRKQCHLITVTRLSGLSKSPSVFLNWVPSRLSRDLNLRKGSSEIA